MVLQLLKSPKDKNKELNFTSQFTSLSFDYNCLLIPFNLACIGIPTQNSTKVLKLTYKIMSRPF